MQVETRFVGAPVPTSPGQPAFVEALRRQGRELSLAMPIPSQQTEEWRYTDLSALELDGLRSFAPATKGTTLDDVAEGAQLAVGEIGERAGLLIQHNSELATVHLADADAARGVLFEGLDDAVERHPDLLAARLHHAVPAGRSKFTALHAAYRTGGAFVHVPAGVGVTAPLQSLTYVDTDGLAVFPHTLIVLEEGAELTFIDRYVSPDLGAALSDAVVEIFAGPNSRLRYVALQDWGSGMTHLSVQRAVVERDAEVRSLAVAFGASVSRMEAESILEGDGGSSELLGVYFGDGHQHFDFRSIQDHIGSRTASDLLYKGVLRDRSRAIYSGTVIIRPGAHKVDAYQTNRNILLSETAKADSIPNLEILANDPIRCGHAASVGPVEDETLFYLQSRGIPLEEAQRLIVVGFLQEVLDRVTLEEVRTGLERAIGDELDAVAPAPARGEAIA